MRSPPTVSSSSGTSPFQTARALMAADSTRLAEPRSVCALTLEASTSGDGPHPGRQRVERTVRTDSNRADAEQTPAPAHHPGDAALIASAQRQPYQQAQRREATQPEPPAVTVGEVGGPGERRAGADYPQQGMRGVLSDTSPIRSTSLRSHAHFAALSVPLRRTALPHPSRSRANAAARLGVPSPSRPAKC